MDELRPNLGLLGLVDGDHAHLHHHHHHEKRTTKTEAPDFTALYALPGLDSQQHSSPSSRSLTEHSGIEAVDVSSTLRSPSSVLVLTLPATTIKTKSQGWSRKPPKKAATLMWLKRQAEESQLRCLS